jgi:hypothetical protein
LQRQILEAEDPVWRETLLDYASSKPFRRDVFVRGAARHGPRPGGPRPWPATRLALVSSADPGPFEFPIPIGVLTGDPARLPGDRRCAGGRAAKLRGAGELAPFRATPPPGC